ncbi:uncharacterized protein BDV17DRAFT_296292 [Aspergillus undulatus]|uniref:uncharacterized protein n=1 Tax=Aspergillus undulatus TaxID=1810928 RepID=UPI003CCDCB8E
MDTSKGSPKAAFSHWIRTNQDVLDPNLGFAEALYRACSATLVYLWKHRFKSMSDGSRKQSDAPKLNVVENLYQIGNILMHWSEGIAAGTQDEESSQELLDELGVLLEKAAIMLSDEEESSPSSESSSDDELSPPEEREKNRHGRLHCYIGCMMDLAPVLNKHVSHLQFKAEKPVSPFGTAFRLSGSAQPFAMRIRDRFIDASTALVEWLAEANLERSIRIREEQAEDVPKEDSEKDVVTIFKPYSIFHDSGLGTSVPTQSHYAATLASHLSFLSTTDDESQGRPRVPPIPHEAAIGEAEVMVLSPEFEDHPCALCLQSGWKSRKVYATHVGRHLEEISLACLLRDDDYEDTSDSDADNTNTSDSPEVPLSVWVLRLEDKLARYRRYCEKHQELYDKLAAESSPSGTELDKLQRQHYRLKEMRVEIINEDKRLETNLSKDIEDVGSHAPLIHRLIVHKVQDSTGEDIDVENDGRGENRAGHDYSQEPSLDESHHPQLSMPDPV